MASLTTWFNRGGRVLANRRAVTLCTGLQARVCVQEKQVPHTTTWDNCMYLECESTAIRSTVVELIRIEKKNRDQEQMRVEMASPLFVDEARSCLLGPS